jgi:hypothetical protein
MVSEDSTMEVIVAMREQIEEYKRMNKSLIMRALMIIRHIQYEK